MSKKENNGYIHQLRKFIDDIRRLPINLKSKNDAKRKNAWLTLICLVLIAAALAFCVYAIGWYVSRDRIIEDGQRYQEMYTPAETTPSPTSIPTVSPETVPSATPEVLPTATAESSPVPDITMVPMETLSPEETIIPLATPDENTLVYALETPPPMQTSFAELIMHNSDTIGYLDIEGVISLPVVQKENDNDFYLNHNFDGEEAKEGALFLDGMNRLVPEDDCLIVYGHNMKNDTMFGRLEDYEDMTFLKEHAVIHFDTIYENRAYVPFAAFTASMDSDNRHYFDVRQFIFDETSFELFTLKMQTRSIYDIPVDVKYGDNLLLLVTCDYTNSSGRFILCLRELRDDEPEDAMRALVQQVEA